MMTPLRQQMIEAMQLWGFSSDTRESYLGAVEQLARYYRCTRERLKSAELRAYLNIWHSKPDLPRKLPALS